MELDEADRRFMIEPVSHPKPKGFSKSAELAMLLGTAMAGLPVAVIPGPRAHREFNYPVLGVKPPNPEIQNAAALKRKRRAERNLRLRVQ